MLLVNLPMLQSIEQVHCLVSYTYESHVWPRYPAHHNAQLHIDTANDAFFDNATFAGEELQWVCCSASTLHK